LVGFEAKTSESGLIAGLGDGLAMGFVVGVEVATGRIVGDGLGDDGLDGDGLGDAEPMDAKGDGGAEGTLAGDEAQPARRNATATTAAQRATITRSPPAGQPRNMPWQPKPSPTAGRAKSRQWFISG